MVAMRKRCPLEPGGEADLVVVEDEQQGVELFASCAEGGVF